MVVKQRFYALMIVKYTMYLLGVLGNRALYNQIPFCYDFRNRQ